MYPRTKYEMSEIDFAELMTACKPTPVMMIGGSAGLSSQENANRAWKRLGERMRFDYMTVLPIHGKGARFFSAVPLESDEACQERLEKEKKERVRDEVEKLRAEIAERQSQLEKLLK